MMAFAPGRMANPTRSQPHCTGSPILLAMSIAYRDCVGISHGSPHANVPQAAWNINLSIYIYMCVCLMEDQILTLVHAITSFVGGVRRMQVFLKGTLHMPLLAHHTSTQRRSARYETLKAWACARRCA